MNKKDISLIIDFDDTLVEENAARVVLNRFSPNEYEKISNQYKYKEISFKIYQEKSFEKSLENTSFEELENYSRYNVKVREGFSDLYKYCTTNKIKITILSSGLKNYIQPVVENFTSLEIIAADMKRDKSNNLEFDYSKSFKKSCSMQWGICKCETVEKKMKDNFVIYVGDGVTTDLCASQKCDKIFALNPLYNRCLEENISATKFNSFKKIMEYINKLKGSYIDS